MVQRTRSPRGGRGRGGRGSTPGRGSGRGGRSGRGAGRGSTRSPTRNPNQSNQPQEATATDDIELSLDSDSELMRNFYQSQSDTDSDTDSDAVTPDTDALEKRIYALQKKLIASQRSLEAARNQLAKAPGLNDFAAGTRARTDVRELGDEAFNGTMRTLSMRLMHVDDNAVNYAISAITDDSGKAKEMRPINVPRMRSAYLEMPEYELEEMCDAIALSIQKGFHGDISLYRFVFELFVVPGYQPEQGTDQFYQRSIALTTLTVLCGLYISQSSNPVPFDRAKHGDYAIVADRVLDHVYQVLKEYDFYEMKDEDGEKHQSLVFLDINSGSRGAITSYVNNLLSSRLSPIIVSQGRLESSSYHDQTYKPINPLDHPELNLAFKTQRDLEEGKPPVVVSPYLIMNSYDVAPDSPQFLGYEKEPSTTIVDTMITCISKLMMIGVDPGPFVRNMIISAGFSGELRSTSCHCWRAMNGLIVKARDVKSGLTVEDVQAVLRSMRD